MTTGVLWLLVGPSGVGKDAVLKGLAEGLVPGDELAVVQRVITRPPDPIGEEHRPVTPAAFARLKAAGAFSLDWESHGLSYGLSCDVHIWLDAGQSLIANGARSALPAARAVFKDRMRVIRLSASLESIATRLAARGRETPQAIEQRLLLARTRDGGLLADYNVTNDGELAQAVSSLREIVLQNGEHRCAGQAGSPTLSLSRRLPTEP